MNISRYAMTILLSLIIGCGGGGSGWDDVANGKLPGDSTDSPSENQPELPVAVPARSYLGAGMFAVDSPKFDTETALDILRTSSSPILSYIPGVFGNDKSNYPYMMDTLIAEGRAPHVQLYALCGPCREPRRDGSLVQFRRDLDINELNQAIQNDPEVQSQYTDYLINVIQPLIDRYPELNFTIVPELEDNQTDASFTALLDLTIMVLGGRDNVKFQRNPLYHNGTRTFGDHTVSLEMHTTHLDNLNLLIPGDAVSFDGQLFSFRGEKVPCKVDADFDQIITLIQRAKERQISVHVWRAEWQGLPQCGGAAPHPADRTYKFTYVDQIKELLSL